MKKSNLKKAFALSALMAFVITGSAYAADFIVNAGDEETNVPTINVGTDKFTNNGTVVAKDSITVDGGTFNNTGTIETGTLDILTNNSNEIAGAITADKFIFRGSKDQFDYIHGLSAKLKANELLIIGTKSDINPQMATGLQVLNEDVLKNVENIVVESHGIKTGLVIGSVVGNTDNGEKVNAIVKNVYLKNDTDEQDARVEVYNGSTFTADKIIADGITKVQLNYDSSATLPNIEVKGNGGNFSLQTLGDVNANTANFYLNTITVGDKAAFKTCIFGNNTGANIKSDNMIINLGKNAKADFGGVGDGEVDNNHDGKFDHANWLGNKINFDVDKLTINMDNTDEYNYLIDEANNINEYKDDYSKGVYIHVNGKYNPLDPNIGCGRITVVGSSENNTGNLENDLQRLAYVVLHKKMEIMQLQNFLKYFILPAHMLNKIRAALTMAAKVLLINTELLPTSKPLKTLMFSALKKLAL